MSLRDDQEKEETYRIVLGMVFALMTLPVGVLTHSWALFKMWGWFVVPLGAPPVSMPHALGLGVSLAYITKTGLKRSDEGAEKTHFQKGMIIFLNGALVPLCATAVGWIIHQFM